MNCSTRSKCSQKNTRNLWSNFMQNRSKCCSLGTEGSRYKSAKKPHTWRRWLKGKATGWRGGDDPAAVSGPWVSFTSARLMGSGEKRILPTLSQKHGRFPRIKGSKLLGNFPIAWRIDAAFPGISRKFPLQVTCSPLLSKIWQIFGTV